MKATLTHEPRVHAFKGVVWMATRSNSGPECCHMRLARGGLRGKRKQRSKRRRSNGSAIAVNNWASASMLFDACVLVHTHHVPRRY